MGVGWLEKKEGCCGGFGAFCGFERQGPAVLRGGSGRGVLCLCKIILQWNVLSLFIESVYAWPP